MNQYKDFSCILKSILKEDVLIDEPMKKHTSFKVGGPSDVLVTPESLSDIVDVIKLCRKEKVPYCIIGNGSNILVKDGGIRGVVIKTSKLNNIKIDGAKVTAESGAMLSVVSKKSASYSLTGLEFASGIPGTIGGAITMNAGAYNGEMSQVVESAVILDENGEVRELTKEELELSYRKSAILKYGYIVLSVTLSLKMGDKEKIINRINELTKRRTEKQPLEYPSAGSTFKRPEGHFTGQLIEESGLKGAFVGGAQVSEKHAGFIINKGNASAKDILDLIKMVEDIVKEKYNVELHPEVRIVGEE
ncbi:UDP-N-acetylmuramate dehydrogenase [Haloimpatiens sp. FM7315]|uniref:UDP-N-acetylmuramate dehydrogenase n=1 Tax=Haloimpatiens sp. FM7315 TaxID=3298609 RepID=UPI0035A2C4D2